MVLRKPRHRSEPLRPRKLSMRERANAGEKTIDDERAILHEKTKCGERASHREKTIPEERAMDNEKTTAGERATVSEKTT